MRNSGISITRASQFAASEDSILCVYVKCVRVEIVSLALRDVCASGDSLPGDDARHVRADAVARVLRDSLAR